MRAALGGGEEEPAKGKDAKGGAKDAKGKDAKGKAAAAAAVPEGPRKVAMEGGEVEIKAYDCLFVDALAAAVKAALDALGGGGEGGDGFLDKALAREGQLLAARLGRVAEGFLRTVADLRQREGRLLERLDNYVAQRFRDEMEAVLRCFFGG